MVKAQDFNPGDSVHVSFDGVVDDYPQVKESVWVRYDDGRRFLIDPEHLSPVPTPVLFADINKGDRIRAEHKDGNVCEFTVENMGYTGQGFVCARGIVCYGDDGWQFFRLTPPVPPEPEYEVGAVYSTPLGLYLRTSDGRWRGFNGHIYPHDFLAHHNDVVRLVPEEPK